MADLSGLMFCYYVIFICGKMKQERANHLKDFFADLYLVDINEGAKVWNEVT